MKLISLSAGLLLAVSSLSGQNLIGYSYPEIRKYMTDKYRDMYCNSVSNSSFKYLKYTDNAETSTFLFFLDKDSVCRSVKMIIDRGLQSEKEKELNSLYKKKEAAIWIDSHGGRNFVIEMKNGDYSSEITFEPEK